MRDTLRTCRVLGQGVLFAVLGLVVGAAALHARAVTRALFDAGPPYTVNGFDALGAPAVINLQACPTIPAPTPPTPPPTVNDLINLLTQASRITTGPTATALVQVTTAQPGAAMVFLGATYTVTDAVEASVWSGDDVACAVNPHQLTTALPAWPNMPVTFQSEPVPVVGSSLCVKLSAATTISGSATVLR